MGIIRIMALRAMNLVLAGALLLAGVFLNVTG